MNTTRRKTKIICTIGPACDSEEKIIELIQAGMNIARINCSHGGQKDYEKVIKLIQKVRKKLNSPTAIMIDTNGPEVRLGELEKPVKLRENDSFILTTESIKGTNEIATVNYKELPKILKNKDRILINDGLVELEVVEIKDKNIHCRIINGGEIDTHKSLNFPGINLKMPYISEKDKNDILFGAKMNIDYIACSFVSTKKDIREVKKLLKTKKAKEIGIISKIENVTGIKNLKEICTVSDAIMIARGDLAVETDFKNMPSTQKGIINQCRYYGKPVIVATEMLETMKTNSRPTRAEISDVANAIYDGTSAIMLSAETAVGKRPIKVVETMHEIARAAENSKPFSHLKKNIDHISKNKEVDALAHSTCIMAQDIQAGGIVCFTNHGYTANYIANFKPDTDTIAVTDNEKAFYKMALYWGVHPFLQDFNEDIYDVIYNTKSFCKSWLKLKKGTPIVEIVGWAQLARGVKNMIQIIRI